jgi:hypothetical protein
MSRGSDWLEALRHRYDLSPEELELAREVAATLDVLNDLGTNRSMQGYREARQQRAVLARLLDGLRLPPETDNQGPLALTQAQKHAQNAARARWAKEGK